MDALTKTNATTSLQELFGGGQAPKRTPPAAGGSFAAMMEQDPVDPSKLEAWEGMFYDPTTGEGIVLQNRDSEASEKKYLRTGWFFERPTQAQPTPGGSLEDRSYACRISPFGFLTKESSERMMNLLASVLPADAKVEGIGYNDANPSFPVSAPQREILVSHGGGTMRLAAGGLARQICNYTFEDSQGEVRQNAPAILRNNMAAATAVGGRGY